MMPGGDVLVDPLERYEPAQRRRQRARVQQAVRMRAPAAEHFAHVREQSRAPPTATRAARARCRSRSAATARAPPPGSACGDSSACAATCAALIAPTLVPIDYPRLLVLVKRRQQRRERTDLIRAARAAARQHERDRAAGRFRSGHSERLTRRQIRDAVRSQGPSRQRSAGPREGRRSGRDMSARYAVRGTAGSPARFRTGWASSAEPAVARPLRSSAGFRIPPAVRSGIRGTRSR